MNLSFISAQLSINCGSAGDTHPTETLSELAKDSDMLIQQIMGPLPAFQTLSYESQYLLNVRATYIAKALSNQI